MTKNRATIALTALLFPLAIVAGFTADTWNPYARATAHKVIAPQVVNDAATPDPTPTRHAPLPPCASEDGSGGPIPCRWDASEAGNGIGRSFTIIDAHTWVYDNGEVAHD